jgi:hypothetical protein
MYSDWQLIRLTRPTRIRPPKVMEPSQRSRPIDAQEWMTRELSYCFFVIFFKRAIELLHCQAYRSDCFDNAPQGSRRFARAFGLTIKLEDRRF